MNAKELRSAAEKVMSLKGSISNAAITIAAHILSTVRDDDDELVTEERFNSFAVNGMIFLPGSSDWFLRWRDGVALQVETDGYNELICEVKRLGLITMGQFRSLCRGLGIELKEQQ